VIGLLAGQLRSGEVSSRDLVERSLRLIEAGDGDLGAVVGCAPSRPAPRPSRSTARGRRGIRSGGWRACPFS